MTNTDIIDTLAINWEERTETMTKNLRKALKKRAHSLAKNSFRLLCLIGKGQGAVRTPGTEDFQITTKTRLGRCKVYTFVNSDLQPLVKAELVTVACVGNGVGAIERTIVGNATTLHNY